MDSNNDRQPVGDDMDGNNDRQQVGDDWEPLTKLERENMKHELEVLQKESMEIQTEYQLKRSETTDQKVIEYTVEEIEEWSFCLGKITASLIGVLTHIRDDGEVGTEVLFNAMKDLTTVQHSMLLSQLTDVDTRSGELHLQRLKKHKSNTPAIP